MGVWVGWVGYATSLALLMNRREHAALSVTDNCRFGGGDRGILTRPVPDILVNIAHIGKVRRRQIGAKSCPACRNLGVFCQKNTRFAQRSYVSSKDTAKIKLSH